MTTVIAYDFQNAANYAVGVAALPAGTTLLRARLTAWTSFLSGNATKTFQYAPPNTVMGISWVPHGNAVPIVDVTNWKNGQWYIAGMGNLQFFDKSNFYDAASGTTQTQVAYSAVLDLEAPLFETAAYDIGISLNFQGEGFWDGVDSYTAYQFQAWYD